MGRYRWTRVRHRRRYFRWPRRGRTRRYTPHYRRRGRLYRWRWGRGKKFRKTVKGRNYGLRILFKRVKRRWVPTSRKYWRRYYGGWHRFMMHARNRRVRHRKYQWRWGKAKKKIGSLTYRRRILFKFLRHKRWRPTKRAYWRVWKG